MNHLHVKDHLTEKELQKKMNGAKDKEEYRRWQAILIAKYKDFSGEVIGYIVGVGTTTIYKWIQIYNDEGVESYAFKGAGGRRRSFLSLEEEAKMLLKLSKESEVGRYINSSKIKTEVEKKLSKDVSEDYIYDLLHRHEWRRIVPRPYHPKKNIEKQEDFKKNFRNIWVKR